jgi:hypothetical protein
MPMRCMASDQSALCLDGFCIGQSITDIRFDNVDWIFAAKGLNEEKCVGVGCKPDVAFRGYPLEDQLKLADAVRWIYGSIFPYNIVTKSNLEIFRRYSYECNPSARGIWGERRFLGAYRSAPSKYLTIVGLRLIGGELKVYRIAREFPFHNQDELLSLAKNLRPKYGQNILFYEYLSSNAYSDVIEQHKDGWFARSTMFTPGDLSNNAAELVLIDPRTRAILEPSSMPESGEIKPLSPIMSERCNHSMPIQ